MFTINLRFYLKNLEEDEKIKPKVNRWKVIIKVRTDINEKENRK